MSGFWQGPYTLFMVEAVLVLAALAVPVRAERVQQWLQQFARHRLAPVAVTVFALGLRALLLPVAPVPVPTVHDEFSYLLSADTFAHGRITNPAHSMWQHFETYHVDPLPTYASMYPPLNGLVMAAGQAIADSPFLGVWLSAGLMCGAICWALRGWFAPEWALLAGVIAAIRLATFSYWGNSYWGGAVAAVGGAMVFGALPRLLRASRRRDAVVMALGAAMLANTRPYEGLVFCVCVGLIALWQVRRLRLGSILPPAGAVLLAAAILTGYYNWRAFGSPTTLPYAVHRNMYAATSLFIVGPTPATPVYRHHEMQEFYAGWEVKVAGDARTVAGFLQNSMEKLNTWWAFFVGPVLTLPLLAFFASWRNRKTRLLLFLFVPVVAATALVAFFQPHDIAPATALFYAMFVQGMRVLCRRWPNAVRAVPLVCVVMLAIRVTTALALPPDVSQPKTWARSSYVPLERESLSERILEDGGEHLVLVHYSPGHSVHAEYVNNGADIDNSPIVWARDMGEEKNAELLRYFGSRKVWWLDVGNRIQMKEFRAADEHR
jgi:hypothetical protein